MILLRRRKRTIKILPLEMSKDAEELSQFITRMREEMIKASRIPSQFFNA